MPWKKIVAGAVFAVPFVLHPILTSPLIGAQTDIPHGLVMAGIPTGTPWYVWPIIFLLDLLGKTGLPTETWMIAVKEWFGQDGQTESLVFNTLKKAKTPFYAYRKVVELGYEKRDALTYLFRYIHEEKKLRQKGPWMFTLATLEDLKNDGVEPKAVLHLAELAARTVGVPFSPPLKRLQADLMLAEETLEKETLRETSSEIVTRALTDTQERMQRLVTHRDQTENSVIGKVLEAMLKGMQGGQLLPGHKMEVVIGTYKIAVTNFAGMTQPDGKPMVDLAQYVGWLESAVKKMAMDTPLAPLEAMIVREIVSQSPDLQRLVTKQIRPIARAIADHSQTVLLLERARQPEEVALRRALWDASESAGQPVGLVMPDTPRQVLLWGTPGSGLGVQLSARLEPDYYLGPYSFKASHVMLVSSQQEARRIPALSMIDRHGSVLFVSAGDMNHYNETAAYYRDHPKAGAPDVRRAYFKMFNDLQAAWKSVFPGTYRLAGSPRSLNRRVRAIRRTNWGVRLLHDLDQLSKEFGVLKAEGHWTGGNRSDGYAVYLHFLLAQRLDHLNAEYGRAFSDGRRFPFADELKELGKALLKKSGKPQAHKDAITNLVSRELTSTVRSDSTIVWPGIRSAKLADDLRFWREISLEEIGSGRLPDGIRQFVDRRIRSGMSPSIARAEQLYTDGSHERAWNEFACVIGNAHVPVEERIHAMVRLATHAVAQRNWAEAEFALQELGNTAKAGAEIPHEARAALVTLITRDGLNMPMLLPEALREAIREDVAAFVKTEGKVSVAGPSKPRPYALAVLPFMPNGNEQHNPWNRIAALKPQTRALLDQLVDVWKRELNTAGDYLRAVSVLTDMELIQWLQSVYFPTQPEKVRMEFTRLTPFRADVEPIVRNVRT